MTIQLRRDTAANWTSANPVLASGQPGVETDTIKIKIGDGATAWNALGYLSASVASIVGITGTKAQFDAAVTDGDISYVGHTHAQADVTGLVADLAGKQSTLVSATNIKTVNGESLLGSGDLVVSGGATNLAYDAPTRVVSSDTGTDAILPLMSAGDAGLVPASGGGTTNFLRADGTFAAPAGGGGATGGTATLNFGTGTGSPVATVAVAGQTGILLGSRVRVWFMAATTADHNADEHGLIFPSRVGLSAGNIVAGVGFTIYAETELQLTGDVSVCWEWS